MVDLPSERFLNAIAGDSLGRVVHRWGNPPYAFVVVESHPFDFAQGRL